mmetsp:Transcript_32997/g.105108  ORF Transcript_32997/g.105108 Transcript_32997/m.105108 type:complete len:398 (+) Transcript_32997:941-2134(+)
MGAGGLPPQHAGAQRGHVRAHRAVPALQPRQQHAAADPRPAQQGAPDDVPADGRAQARGERARLLPVNALRPHPRVHRGAALHLLLAAHRGDHLHRPPHHLVQRGGRAKDHAGERRPPQQREDVRGRARGRHRDGLHQEGARAQGHLPHAPPQGRQEGAAGLRYAQAPPQLQHARAQGDLLPLRHRGGLVGRRADRPGLPRGAALPRVLHGQPAHRRAHGRVHPGLRDVPAEHLLAHHPHGPHRGAGRDRGGGEAREPRPGGEGLQLRPLHGGRVDELPGRRRQVQAHHHLRHQLPHPARLQGGPRGQVRAGQDDADQDDVSPLRAERGHGARGRGGHQRHQQGVRLYGGDGAGVQAYHRDCGRQHPLRLRVPGRDGHVGSAHGQLLRRSHVHAQWL